MSDRTKPPPGWRCYKADDGVWQCHPSKVAGWPDDISTLCGRKPAELIQRAWAAMDRIAALSEVESAERRRTERDIAAVLRQTAQTVRDQYGLFHEAAKAHDFAAEMIEKSNYPRIADGLEVEHAGPFEPITES